MLSRQVIIHLNNLVTPLNNRHPSMVRGVVRVGTSRHQTGWARDMVNLVKVVFTRLVLRNGAKGIRHNICRRWGSGSAQSRLVIG